MVSGKINEIMGRNPRKVLDKSECYLLYEAGLFGNKALTWNSYNEIMESGWKGGICMRSKKGVARKEVRYDLDLREVPCQIKQFENLGIPENMIGFNQSMPNRNLLLQGEIMFYNGGLYLFYSNVKKPMNLALAEKSFIAEEDHVKEILFENLTPESQGDLEKLLSNFPTSVVEFSTYSIPVGNMADKNRNTVFWEVRNY